VFSIIRIAGNEAPTNPKQTSNTMVRNRIILYKSFVRCPARRTAEKAAHNVKPLLRHFDPMFGNLHGLRL
jgi:hypothetical protein